MIVGTIDQSTHRSQHQRSGAHRGQSQHDTVSKPVIGEARPDFGQPTYRQPSFETMNGDFNVSHTPTKEHSYLTPARVLIQSCRVGVSSTAVTIRRSDHFDTFVAPAAIPRLGIGWSTSLGHNASNEKQHRLENQPRHFQTNRSMNITMRLCVSPQIRLMNDDSIQRDLSLSNTDLMNNEDESC